MLYVFNVDTGTMFTFDMSLAIESVDHLAQQIEQTYNIPMKKQVLLVSGGEHLNPSARVCSYSAGTDTNPIYLVNLSLVEAVDPPPPTVDQGLDIDFTEKVRESNDMPATYNTVCQRTLLAQQFYESAKELTRICENIVHEQHLQQQGWAAVVANYEDTVAAFIMKSKLFEASFEEFINERETYLSFLQQFHEDLKILVKMPVLPALKAEQCDESQRKIENLFDWMITKDSQNTVDQLFLHCSNGLERFDAKAFSCFRTNIQNIYLDAKKEDAIDIKGLSNRLCGLEKLMFDAKRYVQEQGDLAQSFSQNQARASNIGDTSILPDLCESHRKQLKVMLKNHNQLVDNRRRCVKAKAELGEALHRRFRWIMKMEDTMSDVSRNMLTFDENIKRLRTSFQVVQQIHLAPALYLSAVAEVVRRRAFSQAFLSWASELACYVLTIHNDEITRRKDFQVQFETHFLSSLFPGIEDMPPSFATEAPSIFDSNLPKLTIEDIEQLKRELPHLAENVSIPDITAITNLFLVKSFVKTDLGKIDDRAVEEKIVQVVNEVGLASNLDRNLLKPAESETCLTAHGIPHLKDLDRGCESETDTEEFEKVGQSPLELHFEKDMSSPRPRTHDASTLTEDNLQTSRTEQDRLKSLILNMAVLAQQAIGQLRLELNELKLCVVSERGNMEFQYESLTSSWENLAVEMDNKEREIVHRITIDHELEINDFKRVTETKEQELKTVQDEVMHLESSLRNSSEEISCLKKVVDELREEREKENEDFEKSLNELKADKEQSVKEVSEKLTREHKAEIENIRSRFRLMAVAKMERTPSETNLDGIERGEIKELTNHEAIISQLKENCEIEKEKAVSAAVLQESRKWESLLNEKLSEMKSKYELDKQILLDDIGKRIVEDKDKQIDLLREREANLNLECIKYKSTIQQLAESESESQNVELLERMEALEKEKVDLETQLCLERSKRIDDSMQDMGASVAVCEGKINVATSPIKHTEKLTKSQTSLVKSGRLSIDSCHSGDAVLVLWDSIYKNYRIIQEGSHLYFLHSDCLETMNLIVKSDEERKPYFTGEVIEKDYCHAKKVGNRYNVPKGTKFFRVKVKPLSNLKELKEVKEKEKSHMSQSETAGPSVSEQPVSDNAASWSLPVTPLKQSPVEADQTQKSEMEASTESSR